MDNMTIYNKYRKPPKEALKSFSNGRFSGTDISPMWRIQVLTEAYGAAGIGWFTEILRREFVPGANDTVAAFVDINLYVKDGGEWSKPIFGTGGNMFIASETKGLRTSDEAIKMAYTDALSVACKALGIGADVYWDKGSKYERFYNDNGAQDDVQDDPDSKDDAKQQPAQKVAQKVAQPAQTPPQSQSIAKVGALYKAAEIVGKTQDDVHKFADVAYKCKVVDLTDKQYDEIMTKLRSLGKASA